MKVAVLCARSNRNGGMYSVDSAALHFFRSIDVQATLCRTQGAVTWGDHTYLKVQDWSELYDFSAIVIWGDWQTNPKYGAEDYVGSERKYEKRRSVPAALQKWRNIYQLLAMPDEDQRPVLTIGTSFIGVRDALSDAQTLAAFENYVNRSKLILPRCHASLTELSTLFPGKQQIAAGLDAAFLNPIAHRSGDSRPKTGSFTYCFDRELSSRGQEIVNSVAKQTRSKPLYIDWNRRRFPRSLTQKRFASNMQLLQNSDFCITDLYHLSANALHTGVPVICFGREMPGATVTTSALKKRSLMATLGVSELYCNLEDALLSGVHAAVDRLEAPDTLSKVAGVGNLIATESERIRTLVKTALYSR